MKVTEQNLEKFRTWMLERGRVNDTATAYIVNIRTCADDPKGMTHRLISGKLAPNTLRANLAALRAWADFTEDLALRKRLKDIRLPPARRVRSKSPLDRAQWARVIGHLRTRKFANEPMRHVLLIIALRGMRCGDVIRIKREEVVRAIETGRLSFEAKGRKRIEYSAAPIREHLEALAEMRGWSRIGDLLGRSVDHKIIRKNVWRAARRCAAEVTITEMNPHRFRHTYATNYLNVFKGDPNAIIKLQKHMHWESMTTAARYVDAVSMDELDTAGDDLIKGLK